MARAPQTTQEIPFAGLAVNMTGPTVDGDIVDAGNGAMLVVNNGSGASINVTILNPSTQEGLAVGNRVVAVAAGATKHIPVTRQFKQPSDASVGPNQALVDYSAVASVTRAVIRNGAS
ncbi:MAG: hypothetical protein HOQ21_09795 [Dermatophilaceae bacterium]|nr:hypothetical protein [Dermatophilaceae bacterium]